jgi:hypothetical protein
MSKSLPELTAFLSIKFVLNDLKDNKHYAEKLELLIQEEDKRYHEFVYEDNPSKELLDRYEGRYDLGYSYKKDFPNFQRSSLLIFFDTFLEYRLNNLCELCAKRLEKKIRVKDIHGNGIPRAINYLEKVIELDLTSIEKILEEIFSIHAIRNCFVHNTGFSEKLDQNTLTYIEKSEHLGIYGFGKVIEVKETLVPYYIQLLFNFYNGLIKVVKNFNYKNRKKV